MPAAVAAGIVERMSERMERGFCNCVYSCIGWYAAPGDAHPFAAQA